MTTTAARLELLTDDEAEVIITEAIDANGGQATRDELRDQADPGAAMTGPYESARDAHAAALDLGGPPRSGWSILSEAQNRAMLTAACQAAGVKLGEYDARILGWLAGFEDSTCAVVASLIQRASQASS